MRISEISVRRPVFATVISLLLVIFGLVSLDRLAIREYPDIDRPVVSVTTNYVGASAPVIETKITQVIEDSIAGIEGILKIESESEDERSQVRIEFDVNRDVDAAANDVRDRVSREKSYIVITMRRYPRFVNKQLRDEYRQDVDIYKLASELVVDEIVPGDRLRSINVLAGSKIPLAIIPAGTGTLLATNLDLPPTIA